MERKRNDNDKILPHDQWKERYDNDKVFSHTQWKEKAIVYDQSDVYAM